jgi:NitT/TauT family transport system substrate-binding protein
MQALLGGSTQLVATTPEDLIRATEAGAPTVILAGVLNGLTHSLMANPKFKRVGDLKGGKVAASSITGSVTYALKLMLAKNDVHYPKDYLIIQIGGSGVRFAALKSGGIDAALVAEPLALVAEEAGLNNIGFVGDYLPHMQVTVIGVKSDWAKANRPLVVRYLKGLVRTFRWLYANKEEGIEATSAIAKVEKKFGARGYQIYTGKQVWPIDGSPTMEGIKVVLDSMHTDKILAAPQRPEKYVDLSYLNEALKQLGAK